MDTAGEHNNDDLDISMEDFLEHYGVKGMQWGVRKAKEKRASAASPYTKAKRLSDQDLKAAVERMRLEQQYVQMAKSLKKPNPAKQILSKIGNKTVEAAGAAVATAAVGAAIVGLKKAYNNKDTFWPTLGG